MDKKKTGRIQVQERELEVLRAALGSAEEREMRGMRHGDLIAAETEKQCREAIVGKKEAEEMSKDLEKRLRESEKREGLLEHAKKEWEEKAKVKEEEVKEMTSMIAALQQLVDDMEN